MAQAVAYLPFRGPRTYTHGDWLQTIPDTTHLVPQMTHPKGGLGRHQSPVEVNPALGYLPLVNSSSMIVTASPYSQSS